MNADRRVSSLLILSLVPSLTINITPAPSLPFRFACPDWTERRPHLGGVLGAALWAHGVERGWVVKQQGTRAIIVTDLGKQKLREQFGIQMEEEPV